MADLPKLNVVIANNFGHLPMFVGAEKGFFKRHGVDASFRVVDTGTDMTARNDQNVTRCKTVIVVADISEFVLKQNHRRFAKFTRRVVSHSAT